MYTCEEKKTNCNIFTPHKTNPLISTFIYTFHIIENVNKQITVQHTRLAFACIAASIIIHVTTRALSSA